MFKNFTKIVSFMIASAFSMQTHSSEHTTSQEAFLEIKRTLIMSEFVALNKQLNLADKTDYFPIDNLSPELQSQFDKCPKQTQSFIHINYRGSLNETFCITGDSSHTLAGSVDESEQYNVRMIEQIIFAGSSDAIERLSTIIDTTDVLTNHTDHVGKRNKRAFNRIKATGHRIAQLYQELQYKTAILTYNYLRSDTSLIEINDLLNISNTLENLTKESLNTALDFTPVIGNIKAGAEAISGRNMYGEILTKEERIMIATAVIVGGAGAAAFKGMKVAPKAWKVLKKLAKKSKPYLAKVKLTKLTRIMKASEKQLRKKFKHAADFGVTGNQSRAKFQDFNLAIQKHINKKGIKKVKGSYRGDNVVFYTDPKSGLTVIEKNGEFLSGWKLSNQQLQHVLKDKKL